MKKCLYILLLPLQLLSQEVPNSVLFWNALQTHCGKAFEGTIVKGGKEGDGFVGEKLVMHVRSCTEDTIKIPFFVGEDASRTWIFTRGKNQLISLKHEHRHRDGSEDAISQYGGANPNTGLATIQFFPADQHTSKMLPKASTNIWWVTLDASVFTYNLRRLGTERVFSVVFDLTKEIKTSRVAWGAKD